MTAPGRPLAGAAATDADFLAITGPTTSGKTALSLEVARRIRGEVISMDSRQVYRGMDIGTAKVGLQDRALVPHHGLDLLDPDRRYSAGQFAKDATAWIQQIRERGRVPILVGGTGFFLKAVTDPLFDEPFFEAAAKSALEAFLDGLERDELERWVRALDPQRADLAAEGGRQRMRRTCSVAILSGRRLSWWHDRGSPEPEGLDGVVAILDVPRDVLDERIDARVDDMVEAGLVEEVRTLVEAGFDRDAPGMSATGYREIVDYLEGRATLSEAKTRMAAQTRQYARRQLTWFRGQRPVGAFDVSGTIELEDQVDRVVEAWETRRNAVEGAILQP